MTRQIPHSAPEPMRTTGLLSAAQEEIPLKKTAKSADHPREIRRKCGLNQQEFWPLIGVTQSGGSRYESGRRMPKPVRELLRIVHVEGIPLQQVRGDDFALLQYLKKSRPGLYRELKAAAQRERKPRK
jgi:DNA-binding transcriptional regulator YiaG